MIPLESLVLAAALVLSSLVDDKPPAALSGLDPVLLCQGLEKTGNESIDVVHGRYRYLFTNEANRSTFEKDPARYRIQMGGGCARMGPLSGAGGPSRFAVHDGKIYIFASDGCRTGFLADPESHLDKDDPRPKGDAAAIEKGRALVERAVAGAGGAKALDAVSTYAENRRREVESGGEKYVNEERLLLAFPDSFRTESAWNDRRYTNVVKGDAGFMADSNGVKTPMDESQVAALRHDAERGVLAILKARSRPDFVAVAEGASATTDGVALEKVAVAFDGTTTTLGLDPATGRVVKAWYRGRRGAGPPGPLEVTYSDFRDAGGGLTLPATRRVDFEGKAVESLSGALEIDVNPMIHPSLFAL